MHRGWIHWSDVTNQRGETSRNPPKPQWKSAAASWETYPLPVPRHFWVPDFPNFLRWDIVPWKVLPCCGCRGLTESLCHRSIFFSSANAHFSDLIPCFSDFHLSIKSSTKLKSKTNQKSCWWHMITQDTSITWRLYDTYTTKYDDTAIPWDSQVSDSHGKNILKDLYFTSGKHGHMVKIHHVKIRIYFLVDFHCQGVFFSILMDVGIGLRGF